MHTYRLSCLKLCPSLKQKNIHNNLLVSKCLDLQHFSQNKTLKHKNFHPSFTDRRGIDVQPGANYGFCEIASQEETERATWSGKMGGYVFGRPEMVRAEGKPWVFVVKKGRRSFLVLMKLRRVSYVRWGVNG